MYTLLSCDTAGSYKTLRFFFLPSNEPRMSFDTIFIGARVEESIHVGLLFFI